MTPKRRALYLAIGKDVVILLVSYGVVRKASDDFHAAIFLLGLLGYRRISWQLIEHGKELTEAQSAAFDMTTVASLATDVVLMLAVLYLLLR